MKEPVVWPGVVLVVGLSIFVELDVNQDGYVDRTEVSATGAADRGRSR